MGMNYDNRDFDRVVALLRKGDPVPIDFHARLVEAGYDVETMERTYGHWSHTAPYLPEED